MSRSPLIAIVDDDAAVREALGDLLQVAGFESVAFDGGAELIRDDPGRFDLVITDLKMPRMDGVQLIHRLHSKDAAPPTLVLTSCVDEDMRRRAIEAGASHCLTKPVADQVLLQRIDSILGGAEAGPQRRQ